MLAAKNNFTSLSTEKSLLHLTTTLTEKKNCINNPDRQISLWMNQLKYKLNVQIFSSKTWTNLGADYSNLRQLDGLCSHSIEHILKFVNNWNKLVHLKYHSRMQK